jgi:hypothetical protein
VRLLTSISSLGLSAVATLLAGLPLDQLQTRRLVAAYVGRYPQERSAGSLVRGRSRLGPIGPADLRKALYMPALAAMRANPSLRGHARHPPARVARGDNGLRGLRRHQGARLMDEPRTASRSPGNQAATNQLVIPSAVMLLRNDSRNANTRWTLDEEVVGRTIQIQILGSPAV